MPRGPPTSRAPTRRRTANERRQIKAAEQIVEVLGQMKGAAMKVGQVASFIDLSGLPPEAQEMFQAKLAALRDSAPQAPFKEMRKVIESDLRRAPDGRVRRVRGRAARGRLDRPGLSRAPTRRPAGRGEGSVPGVAQAVRADLQNLGLLLRAAKRMAPGLDPKAMAREIGSG